MEDEGLLGILDSAEHRMIRDTVREFCEEEIRPIAQEIEDEHRFPDEVFADLNDLDMMGVPISEGTAGSAATSSCTRSSPRNSVASPAGSGSRTPPHTSLGAKPIELFGTPEQKGGGSDRSPGQARRVGAHGARQRLRRLEHGHDRRVRRRRRRIRAERHEAVHHERDRRQQRVLVKAVTDSDAGYDGISTFIVDPADDGFEVTTVWDKMGLNCSPTCEILLDDVRIPEDRLLGEEGEGWTQTMKTLDGGRISIAALSVGLAQGAYEAAKEYAGEREQFGKPIAKFDAIRDKVVHMHRQTERARLLTHKAATTYDAGNEVTRESALAKLDASEAAREVAEEAVQTLGGYGYTTDFAPQRFYRDAKLMEIGEGTSEIQHVVLGRELGL